MPMVMRWHFGGNFWRGDREKTWTTFKNSTLQNHLGNTTTSGTKHSSVEMILVCSCKWPHSSLMIWLTISIRIFSQEPLSQFQPNMKVGTNILGSWEFKFVQMINCFSFKRETIILLFCFINSFAYIITLAFNFLSLFISRNSLSCEGCGPCATCLIFIYL